MKLALSGAQIMDGIRSSNSKTIKEFPFHSELRESAFPSSPAIQPANTRTED